MRIVGRRSGGGQEIEPHSAGAWLRANTTPARVVLVLAALVVAGLAALEMSGSAQRTAATNQINASGFYASVQKGQRLCQPAQAIPADAGGVRFELGSYGKPVPAVTAWVVDATTGKTVSRGTLPANGPEGYVTVPLRPGRQTNNGSLCLTTDANYPIVVAGEQTSANPTDQTVNGKPQPAVLSLTYVLPGTQTWWQMLPTLVRRFGYGKWGFLGGWTFIVGGIALMLVWIGALRLLWKELSS